LTGFGVGSIETSGFITRKLVRILRKRKCHSTQGTCQCNGSVPSITVKGLTHRLHVTQWHMIKESHKMNSSMEYRYQLIHCQQS